MRRAPTRSACDLAAMRKAGRVVAEMHEAVRKAVKPGVNTAHLAARAAAVIERRGAKSNFLGYGDPPFPSVICTSVNSEVVHGIPGGRVLEEGDVLSVDCGAVVDGFHGDAAFTMGVGAISKEAARLIEVTEAALWSGLGALVAGGRLHDVGRAVETTVSEAGFAVVEDYVGHGIGRAMHEAPDVPNWWPGRPGPTLERSTTFAVEPMVATGGGATVLADDGWTVITADGGLAAHFEHTAAVGTSGPEVLTLP